MTDLAVLNSSLTVNLILQNWTPDTFLPFMDQLIKKGFLVSQPKMIEQTQVMSGPLARKATTTDVEVDYRARRIFIQITNNVNSPHENVNEILSILSAMGYEPREFVERIDIRGNVIIKVQDDTASSFVPEIVKNDFIKKIDKEFDQPLKAVGIRLSSSEPLRGSISKSPFIILIEPLFTDLTDTKFSIQVIFMSDSSEQSIRFLQNLYNSLKQVIMVMKHG